MQAQTIYQDIAKRTGGDIYIGDAVIIALKKQPDYCFAIKNWLFFFIYGTITANGYYTGLCAGLLAAN